MHNQDKSYVSDYIEGIFVTVRNDGPMLTTTTTTDVKAALDKSGNISSHFLNKRTNGFTNSNICRLTTHVSHWLFNYLRSLWVFRTIAADGLVIWPEAITLETWIISSHCGGAVHADAAPLDDPQHPAGPRPGSAADVPASFSIHSFILQELCKETSEQTNPNLGV